ncbi:MAG: hypothetical protein P1U63_10545 [Coxiellaceae bacterium]|nr:hypothetical protein [Coxiellaceae bacterium]
MNKKNTTLISIAIVGLSAVSAGAYYRQHNNTDTPGNYFPYRELVIPSSNAMGNPGTPVYKGQAELFSGINYYFPNLDTNWKISDSSSFPKNSKLASSLYLDRSVGKYPGLTLVYNKPDTPPINFKYIKTNFPNNCKTIIYVDPNPQGVVSGVSYTVPGKLQCNLQITDQGTNYTLPIILVDGDTALATKSIDDLLSQENTENKKSFHYTNPLVVASGVTSFLYDNTNQAAKLDQLFFIPSSGKVTYSIDSTPVCKSLTDTSQSKIKSNACTVGKIYQLKGIGQLPIAVDAPTITDDNELKFPSDNGLYQVTVRADYTSSDGKSKDTAYQTFYMNKPYDPGVFFTYPIVGMYVYGSNKSAETIPNDDYNQMARYAKDINTINGSFFRPGTEINELYGAGTQLHYNGTQINWLVGQSNTPYNTVLNDWATTKLAQSSAKYPQRNVDIPIQSKYGINDLAHAVTDGNFPNLNNVHLDVDFEQPSYTYEPPGKSLSAEFPSMNQQQLNTMADLMFSQLVQQNVNSGKRIYNALSTDFEKGFTQSNINNYFFKALSDKLAYQGYFLSVYDFPNRAFVPDTVVALGPTGVGIFSSYDATVYRTPNDAKPGYNKTVYPAGNDMSLNSPLPLGGGFSETQAALYAQTLTNDQNCDNYVSGSGVATLSRINACSSTPNSAGFENDRIWRDNFFSMPGSGQPISPIKLFGMMDAHFMPVLSIAASDSQSPYLIHVNPNVKSIDTITTPGISAVIDKSCTSNPTSLSQLQACLGQVAYPKIKNAMLPLQLYSACPVNLSSYSQCFMTAGPLHMENFSSYDGAGVNQGYRVNSPMEFANKSFSQYQGVRDTGSSVGVRLLNPNLVGVAAFAYEDVETEGGHGCNVMGLSSGVNTKCYEPWYIGLTPAYGDAFYQAYETSFEAGHDAIVSPLINIDDVWKNFDNLVVDVTTVESDDINPALRTVKSWPYIAWPHDGLPLKPISCDSSACSSGAVTLDAYKVINNSISKQVKAQPVSSLTYRCHVMSRQLPQTSCTIDTKGNISLSSTPGDQDYAVQISVDDYSDASVSSHAITASSVYVPIVKGSLSSGPYLSSISLSIPNHQGTSATAAFSSAYFINVPKGVAEGQISYECTTSFDQKRDFSNNNCSVSGNTVTISNVPTTTDPNKFIAPWVQMKAIGTLNGKTYTSNSPVQAVPFYKNKPGLGMAWPPGAIKPFQGSSSSTTFTGPVYKGAPGKLTLTCLYNGKPTRLTDYCIIQKGVPSSGCDGSSGCPGVLKINTDNIKQRTVIQLVAFTSTHSQPLQYSNMVVYTPASVSSKAKASKK